MSIVQGKFVDDFDVTRREPCPKCGRRDYTERDASGKREGAHYFRAYRHCHGCNKYWSVRIDAQSGEEFIEE